MSEKLLRPRQVTTAGWMIVLGSVAAVISIWDQVSRLRSLDTRKAVEETITQAPFDSLGLDVPQLLDLMHVLALVTGACATAAAVLGWQVMQRQKAARLVLTILAVPLLVGGMGSGGFFTTLVAISVVMLWIQPARDWFDGIEPPEPSSRAIEPTSRAVDSSSSASDESSRAVVASPADERRPVTVTIAAALTWLGSAVMSGILIASCVVVARDPDAMIDEAMRQQPELSAQGVTGDLLVATMIGFTVIVVLFSVATSIVAFFALRRHSWARTTWLVLVGIAAGALLLASVVNVVISVPMLAAVVTLSLLFRADTRAWFTSGHDNR